MTDLPSRTVKMNGPPIEPQTQTIFEHFNPAGVVGIMLTGGVIRVEYRDGTRMVFTPSFDPSSVN